MKKDFIFNILLLISLSICISSNALAETKNYDNLPATDNQVILILDSASSDYLTGDTVKVNSVINGDVTNLSAVELHLTYDPAVLQLVSVSKGSSLNSDWLAINENYNNTSGKINLAYGTINNTGLLSGQKLSVAQFTFQTLEQGITSVKFDFDDINNRSTYYQVKNSGVSSDMNFNGQINGLYNIELVSGSIVSGRAKLEAIPWDGWQETAKNHGGIQLTLLNQSDSSLVSIAETGDDGNYIFPNDIPKGKYRLVGFKAGYLKTMLENIDVISNCPLHIDKLLLLTGDINANNVVDFDDLIILANSYNTTVLNPQADLDGNSKVDITDLVYLARNFKKAGYSD